MIQKLFLVLITISVCLADQYEIIIKDIEGKNRSIPLVDVDTIFFRKLPAEGLLVYYPFNQKHSDTIIKDFSGNGNMGFSHHHNLQKIPGRYEWLTASYFAYEKDFIEVPNVINGKSEMTISFWFKSQYSIQNETWHWVYGTSPESGSALVDVGAAIKGDRMTYHFRTSSKFWRSKGVRYIDKGTWYNIIMTYDGSEFQTFVNNTLDVSNSMTGKVYSNQDQLLGFGYIVSANEGYAGAIDDFRIYDRALTEEERTILYQEGMQKPE